MKHSLPIVLLATLLWSTSAMATKNQHKESSDSLMLKSTLVKFDKGDIDIALSLPQLKVGGRVDSAILTLAANLNEDVCGEIARLAPAIKDSLNRSQLVATPKQLELYVIKTAQEVQSQSPLSGHSPYQYYSDWQAFGNDQIVSIFVRVYSFTGGAHGMTTGFFKNYGIKGNDVDLLGSVVDTALLADLGSEYFCRERHLPQNAIRLQTGLFFELKDLPLPSQMGFSAKGLVLYFNQYEIAPYSFGPISVTIPYKRLESSLGKKFYNAVSTKGGQKSYNNKTRQRAN